MRAWLAGHDPVWSSHLLRTEALRAAPRLRVDDDAVEKALATVSLVLPVSATFSTAGRLAPPGLRSADALHLASALELGSDLQGLLTYDVAMTHAALEMAIPVLAPT